MLKTGQRQTTSSNLLVSLVIISLLYVVIASHEMIAHQTIIAFFIRIILVFISALSSAYLWAFLHHHDSPYRSTSLLFVYFGALAAGNLFYPNTDIVYLSYVFIIPITICALYWGPFLSLKLTLLACIVIVIKHLAHLEYNASLFLHDITVMLVLLLLSTYLPLIFSLQPSGSDAATIGEKQSTMKCYLQPKQPPVAKFHSKLTNLSKSDNLSSTLTALLVIIDQKDRYTCGHSLRVQEIAQCLADKLNVQGNERTNLSFASLFHDIGKIQISRSILTKSMPLLTEEWELLSLHPLWGVEILREHPILAGALPYVLHHHERYDGSGYPNGLIGNDIPACARILTVADSIDAMTAARPYQLRKNREDVIKELRCNSNKQFDPIVSKAAVELINEKRIL